MAEQNSHDVVNQTQSEGDVSPSDGPASKLDNFAAEGDGEGFHERTNQDQILEQTSAGTGEGRPGERGMNTSSEDLRGILGERMANEVSTGDGASTRTLEGSLKMNGVGSLLGALDDRSSSPNVGDASGGSDTDVSRTDLRTADGNQHSRTSSVKRPSAFKPVSFTKFSVSKSPGPAPAAKPSSEKATFSTSSSSTPQQQTSRPRLVAKTAGSLRDAAPRTAGGNKAGSSGPDPSQVWNKNRPSQPASTRNLTDEELKKQYGIHLTSRMQSDGAEKEAKWADIDDDEDDWAPESIEWNDGTKITLSHTDTLPPTGQPEADQRQTAQSSHELNQPPPEREPPKPQAPKTPSTLGPRATVLRLGGHADKQQAKSGADASKYPNEKATLVAKGTTKSPWAPLPPVEKISPVGVNPPTAPTEASRPSRPSPVERPAPEPAKEIAADDFNRSWRENQSSAPRELYNSQSGRYEPVVEGRRGQPKNEQFRPASLLQRSAHPEQSGPAEPSAAFQTNRTSAHEGGPWSRRRASSNLSGGSGSAFGRRMSMNKPDLTHNDIQHQRRDLQQDKSAERSVSPRRASQQKSPLAPGASLNNQPPLPPNGPHRADSHTVYSPPGYRHPASSPQQVPSGANEQPEQAPGEDPVALQQRIMREKREEARRRKSEEDKAEVMHQERVRKMKLEALGAPSANKQTQPTPEPAKQSPTSTSATVHSPPKPPVPELTGEPKQYGMMKVHHPESVKKLVGDRMPEKNFGPGSQGRQQPPPSREGKADAKPPEPAINGVRMSKEPSESQASVSQSETQPDEKQPHWKAPMPTTPAAFPSWAGARLGASSAPGTSLWGPPNADRALGNGTFDRNLTSFPPQDVASGASLGLTEQLPVGPTGPYNERLGAPERLQASLRNSGPRSMADNNQPVSPLQSPEKRAATLQGAEQPKPIARPGPIGPPTAAQVQRRQPDQQPRHSEQTAAWQNFHSVAARAEAEESERFRRELAAVQEEEARTGTAPSLQVTFNETWRQVNPGSQAGQRNVVGVTATKNDRERETPLASLQNPGPSVDSLPLPHDYPKPSTTVPGRGSRFFPQGVEQPQPPPSQDTFPTRLASPPPPEVSSHPVYTGESNRPLVHLPTPKPRVKLPPRNLPPSPPTSLSSATASSPPTLRAQAKPIVSTSVWQDRFNGLFGKKSQQSKGHSLAVASATKEPLDVRPSSSAAAVSLPRNDLADSRKVTSKVVEEEEAIFEDREAGSLPVVRVPNMAPVTAWRPAPAPNHSKFRSKYQKSVQTTSIEPYVFGESAKDNAGSVFVVIHLPGNGVTKSLPWSTKKGGSSSPRQRANPNNRHRKGARSRDGPTPHHGQQSTKKPAPANAPSGAPRSSTHTGVNWAARVAGTNV